MPKLCVPLHEGLPHTYLAPTLDGFTEPDVGVPVDALPPDPNIPNDFAKNETGWTHSPRLTYAGGTLPLVVFQAIKHRYDPYLYLSFMVRHDDAYHNNDRIILVFRGAGAAQHEMRRIDIMPIKAGSGVVINDSNTGAKIGSTIKRGSWVINGTRNLGQDPSLLEFYTGNPAGATSRWQSTPMPSNITVAARSWDGGTNEKNWGVEIRLPTKAADGGANWIDLEPNFFFYFNVIRVSQAVTAVQIQAHYVVEFTWPRNNLISSPIGAPSPGPTNYAIDPAWLGEVAINTTSGCGGVRFVGGSNGIGVWDQATSKLTGALKTEISRSAINTFVARVRNDGTTDKRVKATFRIANWGLGSSNDAKWDLVPTNVGAPPPPAGNINPTDSQLIPGGGVTALTMDWKLHQDAMNGYTQISDYTTHWHQCIWVTLDSETRITNPPDPSEPPDAGDVDFIESSVRQNMNFVPASVYEEKAEVSGVGYDPPKDGSGQQAFLLVVSKRQLISTENYDGWTDGKPDPKPDYGEDDRRERYAGENGEDGDQYQQLPVRDDETAWLKDEMYQHWAANKGTSSNWLWILNGYRKTNDTIMLDQEYPIYEAVGSFGYVVEHQGDVRQWRDTVEGDGLKQVSEDTYELFVKDGDVSTISIRLEAAESGGPDIAPDPRGRGCPASIISLLAALGGALLRAIQELLKPKRP